MTKILIVEDNEMNRDMLSRRLSRKGYEIEIAVDGAEGLVMMRNNTPDLVLMDMGLPVMDGWEATTQTKADQRSPTSRLLPSPHAMEEDKQKALGAGADDFDTKPVNAAPARKNRTESRLLVGGTAPNCATQNAWTVLRTLGFIGLTVAPALDPSPHRHCADPPYL